MGEFASFTSLLGNQRPIVDIVADGKVVESGVKKDTSDQIMIQGTLTSGAVMSVHMRGGKGFKGTPALVWRIYGEKGEIRITAAAVLLQMGLYDAAVTVYDNSTDTVEVVNLPKDPYEHLPEWGRNVASLYNAFAEEANYPTFDDAVERHRFIDRVCKGSEDGNVVYCDA